MGKKYVLKHSQDAELLNKTQQGILEIGLGALYNFKPQKFSL